MNDLWCECGLRAVLCVYTRLHHRGWRGSFEARLLFVLDVERCLDQLSPEERGLLDTFVLRGVTQTQAARSMGISLRTCVSRWGALEAKLIRLFLAEGLIHATPERSYEKTTRDTPLRSTVGSGPKFLRAVNLGHLRRHYPH